MKRYLVYIEFKYIDPRTGYEIKKLTIGVFNNFELACEKGNSVLEMLESKFELHKAPDGGVAKKERLSKTGGPFGKAHYAVSNLYLKTPFHFYLEIETLDMDSVEDFVDELTSTTQKKKND